MTKRQGVFTVLALIAAGGWWFLRLAESKSGLTPISFANVAQPAIDLTRFNRVQIGMHLADVRAIIGSPGTLQAQSQIVDTAHEIYIWQNPGGSNAMVQFVDGKVISKAQFGLR